MADAAAQLQVTWTILKVVVPLFVVFFGVATIVMYKWRLHLRYIGPDGFIHRSAIKWARMVKDKETHNMKLQLFSNRKHFIPLPPGDAISSLKTLLGQRLFTSFNVTEGGEYQPVYTMADSSEKGMLKLDPVTRAQYVLIEKAILSKQNTWKQLAFPITCLVVLGMVIISAMIFAGNVAAPLIEETQALHQISIQQGETQEALKQTTVEVNRLLVNMDSLAKGKDLTPPPQTISGGLG